MSQDKTVHGVLDKTYSLDRAKKQSLIFRYKSRAQVVALAAKKYLQQSRDLNILDFGCAEGLTLLEMRHFLPGGKYLGIEYSDELIQHSQQLPYDTKIIQGDVTDLPNTIKTQSFDIVSALAILEHLNNPIEAVQQARLVLKPGGIFIATCPNPYWDNLSTKLGLLRDEQHETDMNKESMIKIVEKAGLVIINYQRFMWAPIGFLPYLRIPISPRFSLICDQMIQYLKILNWTFVNQCVIARCPL